MHLISHHLFVSAVEAERRGESFEWTSERLGQIPKPARNMDFEVLDPAPAISKPSVSARATGGKRLKL